MFGSRHFHHFHNSGGGAVRGEDPHLGGAENESLGVFATGRGEVSSERESKYNQLKVKSVHSRDEILWMKELVDLGIQTSASREGTGELPRRGTDSFLESDTLNCEGETLQGNKSKALRSTPTP